MADIDKLQIEIEAGSSDAAEKVNALASALENLKKSTQGGNLGDTAKQIKSIGQSAGTEKLKQQQQALKEVDKVISEAQKKVDTTPLNVPIHFWQDTAFSDIAKSIPKTAKSIPSQQFDQKEILNQIDLMSSKVKGLGASKIKGPKVDSSVTESITSTTEEVQKLKEAVQEANNSSEKVSGFQKLKGTLSSIGSSGSAGLKQFTSGIKSIGSFIGSKFTKEFGPAIRSIEKWKNAIGRVAFYRAVRTAIKMVTDGFREGIQNLYEYSSLMGTSFAPAMNSLATSSLYLKNSIGAMAAPLIEAVAPAVDFLIDKFVSLLNIIGKVFAALTGKGTFTQATKQATTFGDAVGGAAGSAKELRDYMLGIDELNVINADSGAGGGGGGAGGLDYSTMFEEVEVPSEISDFAKQVRDAIEAGDWYSAGEIVAEKLNDIVDGIDWAGWGTKFGTNIQNGISLALGFIRTFDWQGIGSGVAEFLNNTFDSINSADFGALLASKIRVAVDMAYGFVSTFNFSEFAEWAAGVVNGWFDEIDWEKTGETIGLAIKGALDFAVEFLKSVEWGDIVNAIGDIIVGWWEALGDQQGLATGIIAAISAWKFGPKIVEAFSNLLDLGSATGTTSGAAGSVGALSDAVGGAGSGLNGKLTSLAKNLGLGIGILAEVAVAAGIIVGSVYLLGKGLEQVGIAWEPVIENGQTVATAMGIGTGILAAVGLVAGALGSQGVTIALNVGIGTAILAELGVATGLFLVEIWGIGKGLDEIGKAWQPVLDNGETIATGIGIGTGLLVGIGVVTAALGAATVASAGLLPVAIGLGTAILVELAAAFVAFNESIVAVAKELGDRLAPALEDLNPKLPDLSDNMSNFVDFMTEFAGHVVRYTEASAISALSGAVDTIIGWFTEDPIQKMANDVNKTYEQTKTLNEKLNLAVPELESASELLADYQKFVDKIAEITGSNDNTVLSGKMLVNMKEVGKNLVVGLADGMNSEASTLATAFSNIEKQNDSFQKDITRAWENLNTKASSAWKKIKSTISTLTNDTYKDVKDKWDNFIVQYLKQTWKSLETSAKTEFNFIRTNIQTAWKNAQTDTSTAWTNIKKSITDSVGEIEKTISTGFTNVKTTISTKLGESVNVAKGISWYSVGSDIVSGISSGISDNAWRINYSMTNLAKNALTTAKQQLQIHSPSRVFRNEIGANIGAGIALGIEDSGRGILSSISGLNRDMESAFAKLKTAKQNMSFPVHQEAYTHYAVEFASQQQRDNDTDNFSAGLRSANGEVINTLYDIASQIIAAIGDKDMTVSLDGRSLTGSVERYQRQRGANIMPGGVTG